LLGFLLPTLSFKPQILFLLHLATFGLHWDLTIYLVWSLICAIPHFVWEFCFVLVGLYLVFHWITLDSQVSFVIGFLLSMGGLNWIWSSYNITFCILGWVIRWLWKKIVLFFCHSLYGKVFFSHNLFQTYFKKLLFSRIILVRDIVFWFYVIFAILEVLKTIEYPF